MRLFKSEHNSVVVGTIGNLHLLNKIMIIIAVGLSDTFAYASLGMLNQFILSRDEDPNMFLWFFIALASSTFMAIIVTSLVAAEEPLQKWNNELYPYETLINTYWPIGPWVKIASLYDYKFKLTKGIDTFWKTSIQKSLFLEQQEYVENTFRFEI